MRFTKNSRVEKIEKIKSRFQKYPRWLLIEVKKRDPETDIVLMGRLIAYSPSRDEILKEALKYPGSLKIDRSTYRLPKGYAAVL